MKSKLLTLVYASKNDELLLGLKKRGFGVGKWNGFGGKLEENETCETAAIRELAEEAGISPISLNKMGVLEFEFIGDPQILETHVFQALEFEGEPIETEEMKPQWFKVADIPYQNMWDGDKYWLPLLLEGKRFKGRLLFGENDQVVQHNLEVE